MPADSYHIHAVLTDADVDFVSDLAVQAGRLALDMRSAVSISHKTGPRDFVTGADIACSRLIVDQLKARFPADAVISEEEPGTADTSQSSRIWMIDPIDGTENYVSNDGMYSVMIGLLVDHQPAYGWVYGPGSDSLYIACPGRPLKRAVGSERCDLVCDFTPLDENRVRLMMGNRDREQHPWVAEVPGVEMIYSGSVGLRVAMIAEGSADVYLHLAGKLKVWDTAAPAAMARSAALEIGSLEFEGVPYVSTPKNMHEFPIAIGRAGTLAWMRKNAIAPANL
jgi:3'(2'), 5'-bisphosphate nucleotidase